jgi:TFIIF-interacting CTD phosphatase-like protein
MPTRRKVNNENSSANVWLHILSTQNVEEHIKSLPHQLPNVVPKKKKILILGLNNILVKMHKKFIVNYDLVVEFYEERDLYTYYVKKRPFLDKFLLTVRQWYTVVLYTTLPEQFASVISDFIEGPHKVFKKKVLS